MRLSARKPKRGFTLLELALVAGLGLAVASMLMALVSQQLAFLRIYGAQNFLTDEAPVISLHVSRIIAKADHYRLHANLEDALTGANRQVDASPVLVLTFQQPHGGTPRASILSFETRDGVEGLYYYLVPTGTEPLEEPEWAITRKPENVVFSIQEGILRMTLTGRGGEQITYSGTMQR